MPRVTTLAAAPNMSELGALSRPHEFAGFIRYRCRKRGSRASRNPSPRKLKPSTVIAMASPK